VAMKKVRIPLDVDADLKQDFIDRIESQYGFEGKVKINTILQNLMHYVISADEFELGELLFRGNAQRERYNLYRDLFNKAKMTGLLDGLDMKRGNPRKSEVEYNLFQTIHPKDDDLKEIRQSLEELDKKMKTKEILDEDCENYLEKRKKALDYVLEFGFKNPY
jgi:hypothetical protein